MLSDVGCLRAVVVRRNHMVVVFTTTLAISA